MAKTPGLELVYGIDPVNAVPVISSWGPYADLAEANASVTLRYIGLTVGILSGSTITEYWYNGGITDGHLVLKVGGGNGPGGALTPIRQILTTDAPVNVPAPGYVAIVHYNIEEDADPENFPDATDTGNTYEVFNINGDQDDFTGSITLHNINGRDEIIPPGGSIKIYDYGVDDYLKRR